MAAVQEVKLETKLENETEHMPEHVPETKKRKLDTPSIDDIYEKLINSFEHRYDGKLKYEVLFEKRTKYLEETVNRMTRTADAVMNKLIDELVAGNEVIIGTNYKSDMHLFSYRITKRIHNLIVDSLQKLPYITRTEDNGSITYSFDDSYRPDQSDVINTDAIDTDVDEDSV